MNVLKGMGCLVAALGAVGAPEAKAAKWRLVRDGNTLLLDHTLGLTLILR